MSGQPGERSAPVRIGLIAGGPDGVALLQLLLGWPSARVVVAVDPLPDALVLQQAKSRGIPAATRHLEVFGHLPVDLVIESTGQAAILDEFLRTRPPGIEVIGAQEPPLPSRPAARPDRESRAAGGGRRDPPDHQQLPHRRAAGAGSRRRARRAALRRAGRGSLPSRGRGASPGGQDRAPPLLVDRRGRADQPRLGDGAGRGRSEARPRARSLHVRRRVPAGRGLREAIRPPNHARHSPPARGGADRSDPAPRHGAPPLHRQADPAPRDLRRPGRHRHRERPALQGAGGPEPRPHRDARAADRHGRDLAGHLELADRRPARLRHDRAERRAALRGPVLLRLSLRWGVSSTSCRKKGSRPRASRPARRLADGTERGERRRTVGPQSRYRAHPGCPRGCELRAGRRRGGRHLP